MPQGAFHVFADSSRLTEDGYKFAFKLLEKVGVAPGVDFGQMGKRSVRFSHPSSQPGSWSPRRGRGLTSRSPSARVAWMRQAMGRFGRRALQDRTRRCDSHGRLPAIVMRRAFGALGCWALWIGLVLPGPLLTQGPGWRHSGSLFVLTTQEGADLPASAREDDFPLLVRLHRDFFDFGQTEPKGEDVRFFAGGRPLAYQIEEWDAAKGVASIWVRIPVIRGNARQEIELRWGNPDASSESSGSAVFNKSNGFLSVLHLSHPDHPERDDAGTLDAADAGTMPCAGVAGAGRHFEEGKGIEGGKSITAYPTGSGPHTSAAWFRAERANAPLLGWGNEEGQGKVVMQLLSPPHINMDCYFSGGNVAGRSRLPLSQWIHAAHTYRHGDSRVYIDGVLDGSSSAGPPLAIKSPARMWIGGWYGHYAFVGDIDEVRISRVARSADWIRLEYENQKPLQTLAGMVVQPGNALSVSPAELKLAEGESATFKAEAGGAQKIYWILERGGAEAVLAVDRLSCTLDAGRVTADTSCVLQLRAVYPGEVKTRNVPVTIREEIPEPAFTLKSPSAWNGRDPIEVVPSISNLAALRARGADKLRSAWSVSGGAVIREVAPGKLILKRSQSSGTIAVALTLNNGGADVAAATSIRVTEPRIDPWVERTPGKDEKPEEGQFYARDDRNEGTLHYNGILDGAADAVFLKVYADGLPYKTERKKLPAERSYAFAVKLKPGLIEYRVEFGTRTGGAETVVRTVGDLVCGDAYLIDGQSNALATDTAEESPPETSGWIRSYGSPEGNPPGSRGDLWCRPVWKAQKGEKAELGYWGMELAKRLVASQKIPVFIVNGAVGGTRIDQHLRSESNPDDVTTIYGRMLRRVRGARLRHGIRAILWHQGENNQGAASPTGDYDWKSYQQYFVEMSGAWKQDYPNVQRYYIFQIWPNACSMGGKSGAGDMLREVQRTLPRLYSNMGIMSTLGIQPPGPCHYPLAGWGELARLIQPLIERDLYGKEFRISITPPDILQACYATDARDTIALEFDQPVLWRSSLADQLYLDGARGQVDSGAASENEIVLLLKGPSTARTITYLKDVDWSPENLLCGTNGIAALTFCDVPILPHRDESVGPEAR